MTTTSTAAVSPIDRELEDLIRANMPLVGHLVREMLGRVPSHVNRDDLTSAGLAALVTAAKAYYPERGIPFARFASARVRGALDCLPRGAAARPMVLAAGAYLAWVVDDYGTAESWVPGVQGWLSGSSAQLAPEAAPETPPGAPPGARP